jgi:hypothetical protein
LKALFAYIRICYFLVVLISTCGVTFAVFEFVARGTSRGGGSLSGVYTALILAAFLLPCYRAVRRKLRGQPLVFPPKDTESGIYWGIATLAATIGHAAAGLGATIIIDWIGTEREAPKQVFLLAMLAALVYLIALWIGEFVLMSRTTRLTTGAASEKS